MTTKHFFRTNSKGQRVPSEDYFWRADADPILKEAYDWLMGYYRAHRKEVQAREPPPIPYNKNATAPLHGEHTPYENQGHSNYCWACTLNGMMNEYAGHKVSDLEMIKNRPLTIPTYEESGFTDMEKYNEGVKLVQDMYTGDDTGNPTIFGDYVIKKFPNTAIKTANIGRVQGRLDFCKRRFLETLGTQLEKGPVGLLYSGHYVLVYAIDGDDLKVRDSQGENPDDLVTYKYSAKSIFSRAGDEVELVWLENIEGKEQDIAREFSLDYNEQTRTFSGNMPKQKETILHKDGVEGMKEYDDGDYVSYQVYVPKKMTGQAVQQGENQAQQEQLQQGQEQLQQGQEQLQQGQEQLQQHENQTQQVNVQENLQVNEQEENLQQEVTEKTENQVEEKAETKVEEKTETKTEEKTETKTEEKTKTTEKKEEPRPERVIKKQKPANAKPDGTREKRDGFIYIWEDGKEYRYTSSEEKEYNSFKKKQPKITRDAYAMYKAHDFAYLRNNKEYNKLFKKMKLNIRSEEGGGSTLDRDLQAVMRPVHFNSKGKPRTEADARNHEWNLKWLKCWEDGKADYETADKMIEQELVHIYDDFEELIDIVKENTDSIENLKASLEEYCDRMMRDDPEKFEVVRNKTLSIDNLIRKIPSVRNLDRNTRFGALTLMFIDFNAFVVGHLQSKYGIKHEKVGKEAVIAPKDKMSFANGKIFTDTVPIGLISTYQKNKEWLDSKSKIEFLPCSELRKTHVFDKELKDELKASDPAITDVAVKIMQGERQASAMNDCEEYKVYLNQDKLPEAFNSIAGKTVDRIYGIGMKYVELDVFHKPVNTPENLKNHEWNLKWLKAVTDYPQSENKEPIKKMIDETIKEEMDHFFDEVADIPIPKTADGEEGYIDRLNAWLDKNLNEKPEKFQFICKKVLAWDALMKFWPPFKEFDDKNNYYKQFSTVLGYLYNYVQFYTADKYHINLASSTNDKIVCDKALKDSAKMQRPVFEQMITSMLFDVGQAKNADNPT